MQIVNKIMGFWGYVSKKEYNKQAATLKFSIDAMKRAVELKDEAILQLSQIRNKTNQIFDLNKKIYSLNIQQIESEQCYGEFRKLLLSLANPCEKCGYANCVCEISGAIKVRKTGGLIDLPLPRGHNEDSYGKPCVDAEKIRIAVEERRRKVMEDRIKDFYNLIKSRCSCRKYNTHGTVYPEQIGLIKEAILRAPHASGGPRMEYIVVDNWVKRQQLKDACMGQQYVQDAQYSFIFCGKDEGAILREGFPKYVFDCAFACSQAHLMAVELGLGSCIIGNFIPDRVKEIIGTKLRPVLILIVGVKSYDD